MRRLVTMALALSLCTPALAEVNVTGWVRNYTGLLVDSGDYAIVQNTLQINLDYKGDEGALRVEPYIYQSPMAPYQMGIRQAYIDLYFDSADLRIGKQQIIWGKADGVFITDVVSPKDLSEFLLRDFAEIRTGVTALKADYYLGDHTLELVLVPAFTPVTMPAPGSIWRPQISSPMPGMELEIGPAEPVEAKLENSEVFAKFSGITRLVDFEVMGGYLWDDEPVLHLSLQPGGAIATPKYHRVALGGLSFSTTVAEFVVRGEGAYYHGKFFNTEGISTDDHTVEKGSVHALIGVDKTVWDIKLSVQFIQETVLDYEDRIHQDEHTRTLTALAHMDFLRETLKLDLFAYVGLDKGDALIRPKVTYEIGDALQAVVGFDLFVGDEAGQFGQFGDNNMVYSKVKYTF